MLVKVRNGKRRLVITKILNIGKTARLVVLNLGNVPRRGILGLHVGNVLLFVVHFLVFTVDELVKKKVSLIWSFVIGLLLVITHVDYVGRRG